MKQPLETSGEDQARLAPRSAGPLLLFGAGVIAGVLAWGVLQAVGEPFGRDLLAGIASRIPPELLEKLNAARRVALYKNTALAMGLTGLVLAGGLGLLAGLGRKSARAAVAGALSGLVLGAAFGALAGLAEVFVGEKLAAVARMDDDQRFIAMHATAWGVAGIGIGLTVGLLSRRPGIIARTVAAGIGAGILAGVAYLPLLAVLLPSADPESAIPTDPMPQLVWTTLAGGLAGLAVGRASRTATKHGRAAATVGRGG